MDISLQKYPIPQYMRTRLLQGLWKECGPTTESASLDMSCYFDYHSTRCQRFSRDGSNHICITAHDTLVEIAEQILADTTRHEVYLFVPGKQPKYYSHGDPASTTHTTLDLCARLLLMAEVGVQKFGFSRCNPLAWSSHQTLRQAVESHFQPEKELQPDDPRLGKMFTARNLTHIGGMKIKWTSNIVDHLLLSDDDQTVFIFHHASFLRCQQCFTTPLLPPPLLSETLRTVSFLFPQNDPKTRRWLRAQISSHSIDSSLAQCGNLPAQKPAR